MHTIISSSYTSYCGYKCNDTLSLTVSNMKADAITKGKLMKMGDVVEPPIFTQVAMVLGIWSDSYIG